MKLDKELILRAGLGITFIWIGILVLRDPVSWGSYIRPWAANLLPIPIESFMSTTGIFDIATGALFFIPHTAFIAGILGTLHLTGVIAVSGINEGTVRDIGLLGATLYIAIKYYPKKK